MTTRYAAIVGVKSYYGTRILKPNQVVLLKKDLENDFDEEAIAVYLMSVGKVGYLANSTNTVPRGCYSAGRIYDTFEDYTYAIVRFVLDHTAIIEIPAEGLLHITTTIEVFEKVEV